MKKLENYLVNFGVVLVAAGLAYWAYQGFYNRDWSDDWCYNRDFKDLGVLKTIGLYFATGKEAVRGWPLDRYSMTALSGLVYLPGVFGTQIFTALTIVIWAAAIFWVVSNLAKLNGGVSKNILAALTGFILYYNLYISPDRFQILYWRSGIIPYSYAIIFGLILLGLITEQALKPESSKTIIYLTALVGLIGGGFSEIGCAFLFGGMTLLFAVTWFFKRAKKEWAVRSFSTIQAAWMGLLVSFIVLVVAPSNTPRYNSMQDAPNDPWLVPYRSVYSALFFIAHSISDLPLPHLILFAVFSALPVLAYADEKNKIKLDLKQAARLIAIAAVVAFLLIVAIQAPTTYLYSAPPDPRGQSLARFTMVVGMAFILWILGALLSRSAAGKTILIPMLLLLLGYGYTARAINITLRDYPGFVERARIWDERDKIMRAAEAQGVKRMEVVVIDTREIGTKDIMRSQDMNKWGRSCAGSYYGMDAIKAIDLNPN